MPTWQWQVIREISEGARQPWLLAVWLLCVDRRQSLFREQSLNQCTRYKTDRMVLGGWGSVNLRHLPARHPSNWESFYFTSLCKSCVFMYSGRQYSGSITLLVVFLLYFRFSGVSIVETNVWPKRGLECQMQGIQDGRLEIWCQSFWASKGSIIYRSYHICLWGTDQQNIGMILTVVFETYWQPFSKYCMLCRWITRNCSVIIWAH